MIFRYQPILAQKQLTLFSATLSLDVVAVFSADKLPISNRLANSPISTQTSSVVVN